MTHKTKDARALVERLRDGEGRFLKWAYKDQYSGPPVISIPRHPDNIDALLAEAADALTAALDRAERAEAERGAAILSHMRQMVEMGDTSVELMHGAWNEAIEAAKNVFRQFAPEAVFDAKLIVYKLASIKKGADQ